LTEAERERNRARARVRALVEHPYLVLKRLFGFTKVRYRGLEKNAQRLFAAYGLVNLYLARRRLLRRVGMA
jgi:IS5 family transposase